MAMGDEAVARQHAEEFFSRYPRACSCATVVNGRTYVFENGNFGPILRKVF